MDGFVVGLVIIQVVMSQRQCKPRCEDDGVGWEIGNGEYDPWYYGISWAMMLWKIGKETFKNLFSILTNTQIETKKLMRG